MIRKILCFIGWHRWTASYLEYIEEFGQIPLDGRICKKSKCEFCQKKYKGLKNDNNTIRK